MIVPIKVRLTITTVLIIITTTIIITAIAIVITTITIVITTKLAVTSVTAIRNFFLSLLILKYRGSMQDFSIDLDYFITNRLFDPGH